MPAHKGEIRGKERRGRARYEHRGKQRGKVASNAQRHISGQAFQHIFRNLVKQDAKEYQLEHNSDTACIGSKSYRPYRGDCVQHQSSRTRCYAAVGVDHRKRFVDLAAIIEKQRSEVIAAQKDKSRDKRPPDQVDGMLRSLRIRRHDAPHCRYNKKENQHGPPHSDKRGTNVRQHGEHCFKVPRTDRKGFHNEIEESFHNAGKQIK